jgi:tryptophanyl-tRNA synthetase
VFTLHKLFSPDILAWTEENCRSGALGCVECKGNLADRIVEYYRPFRERRAELEATPDVVDRTLAEGAARARPVAQATIASVREAMHLT